MVATVFMELYISPIVKLALDVAAFIFLFGVGATFIGFAFMVLGIFVPSY